MHPSVIYFCLAMGFLPFAELPPFFFDCPLFFFEPPPPNPLPCLCGGVSQWSFVLWLFFPHLAQCFLYFFVIENLFIVDDEPEALAFQAFLLDSSWITWSMISCNLYFVISSILSRYWWAVSWYESGRAEQNMKTIRSSVMLEWPLDITLMCQGCSCNAEMRTMWYRSANPRGSEVAIRGWGVVLGCVYGRLNEQCRLNTKCAVWSCREVRCEACVGSGRTRSKAKGKARLFNS